MVIDDGAPPSWLRFLSPLLAQPRRCDYPLWSQRLRNKLTIKTVTLFIPLDYCWQSESLEDPQSSLGQQVSMPDVPG